LPYHNPIELRAFKGTHCARAQKEILTFKIVNNEREHSCKLFALRIFEVIFLLKLKNDSSKV